MSKLVPGIYRASCVESGEGETVRVIADGTDLKVERFGDNVRYSLNEWTDYRSFDVPRSGDFFTFREGQYASIRGVRCRLQNINAGKRRLTFVPDENHPMPTELMRDPITGVESKGPSERPKSESDFSGRSKHRKKSGTQWVYRAKE